MEKERNLPTLDLSNNTTGLHTTQPILVIQSPKTPTLSRKLKAISLDAEPRKTHESLDVSRDVFSMPNTPKRQVKARQSLDYTCALDGKATLMAPTSNLKHFASNNSISGSQTLKTLPEVMTLHDFGHARAEPVRIKAKGLLERRGSNASLTIDLGASTVSNGELKGLGAQRINSKSASHLNLSNVTSLDKERCSCTHTTASGALLRRKTDTPCKNRCYTFHKRCNCLCNLKCRRKSLSNENLYVPPPCSYCQTKAVGEGGGAGARSCKGCRRSVYPRQPEVGQLLSEEFKLHLQNIQYLQTAGSVLSLADLRATLNRNMVQKLNQEFWEVPLNLQEKCLVSGSQTKNRYKGVLPNEHSRVHLPGAQPYIHANHIKGPDYTESAYIATQGPMTHTCEDFWTMIWTFKCDCVVMLTGLVEKGTSKCELYFPLGRSDEGRGGAKSFYTVRTTKIPDRFTFDVKGGGQGQEEVVVTFEERNEVIYGNYRIKYLKKESIGECIIRELELMKTDEVPAHRKLYHYWYADWQDHKMANPEQVLQIALHVLQSTGRLHAIETNGGGGRGRGGGGGSGHRPIVAHCSAGIGRTGCFLAILNGIQQLRASHNVDVLAILCSLRLNRGGMVSTAEQYELIHRVLNLYADMIE